ncbi:NAD-dependent succinate-semialdehyde dehydrogenase [Thalassotalea sp. 1_MG-2023]|uniref:NAD-dependent succinate-semialdehyde dehydrogenase n=1 Tax=Thalassotalea sp. 1_MG-2023 TaxID=3062680 RepID=UPI0026E404C7|nr:NAD-dependent succinate-semialdehyde dehydrogenase [Thalassotalea sp. 1_MG-2023]MDO6428359.1 NAD-dependent succinate-semialdehyde dehydrogenase [Thalassotalea sp. 1_MG-2023]
MKDLKNTELLKHGSFINGQWQTSDDCFPVVNPATNEVISKVAEATASQVEQAITAANTAQPLWQEKTSYERAAKLQRWAALINEHKDDLALIMTREQGKTLADAGGEIAYGKSFIDWFAEEAKRVYGDTISKHADNKMISVIKQPVGVVAAITPWNFPTAMITRKAAAALAAGCTIVIKPASETPYSALALAVLAKQAGIPDGVFNIVVGKDSRSIGEQLTQHPLVKKFTFTGSTKVGKLLNKQCAESIKKVSLELGGNAPFIVYDDADISLAVKALVDAKLRNCGQTCISPNRIYLHRPIADAFKKQLVASLEKVTQGNGEAAESDVACLIHQEAAENVHKLVESAKADGGKILIGGLSQSPDSSFFPLTVIDNVTHSSDITLCEIFGPVFSLITFDEPEQAIEQANDTEFGLASYVFSQNINRLQQTTTALDYGMIGVNDTAISHPIAPFGGIKHSGFGKEGSKYGLDDYLIIKAITYGF